MACAAAARCSRLRPDRRHDQTSPTAQKSCGRLDCALFNRRRDATVGLDEPVSSRGRHRESNTRFPRRWGRGGSALARAQLAGDTTGASEHWPQSLKTIARVMLDSRYAMWMLWGPDLTFFCGCCGIWRRVPRECRAGVFRRGGAASRRAVPGASCAPGHRPPGDRWLRGRPATATTWSPAS